MNYWLVKSEPDTFSFDDLKKIKNKTTSWEGVRNYQARNFLKTMKLNDLVFFYHSVQKPTAIVGITKVVKEFYPDKTQFDTTNKYYDPKSTKDNPRWFMVDLKYQSEFNQPITLEEIKEIDGLENMYLLKNSRLSVQPVTESEWNILTNFRK
ncbi:MAG: EVE domain-containing protein [Candidatus Sericytochromatia bacterium]